MSRRHGNMPGLRGPSELLAAVCIAAAAAFFMAAVFAPVAPWLQITMLTCSALLTGYDALFDAVAGLIRRRTFDDRLLILIAAAAAFAIGRAPEGAAAVILFRLGRLLRGAAIDGTADVVSGLTDPRPETVKVLADGTAVTVSAGKVSPGDIVRVESGDYLAFDGVVAGGVSFLDRAALTGPPGRVRVAAGDAVFAGSHNVAEALDIRVAAPFDGSELSRVLDILKRAVSARSPVEKLARRIARYLAPAALLAAALVGVVVPLAAGLPAYAHWIGRALGILVTAYPSALLASVPLAYFAGIGGAAGRGVLYKNAHAVDTMARATSIVFEKTGTLTTGRFRIRDLNACGISDDRLLTLAAYAMRDSEHPMAPSVAQAADIPAGSPLPTVRRELRGRGVEAVLADITISAGNALLMEELGITPDISLDEASVVYIAVNGKYAGRILLEDDVRPGAARAVQELRGMGVDRLAIFTEDNRAVAADLAGRVGIREFYADCLPGEREERLRGLIDMQLPGDRLVYVGAGADDGPALKLADAGVALGGFEQEDAARAADVLILSDDPAMVAAAVAHARGVAARVRQNILLSLGLKGLTLLLVLVGAVPLWLAVLVDVAASLAVVFNAAGALGLNRAERKRARRGSDR